MTAYAVVLLLWCALVGIPNDPAGVVLWIWFATIAWYVDDPDRRWRRFRRDWWLPLLLLVVYWLVRGLAETGAVRPGQLLVHTSGRYGAAVLDPATRAGALPMALHPAMTFTGTTVDVQRLAGCPFGVTAPEQLRTAAQALKDTGWLPELLVTPTREGAFAVTAKGKEALADSDTAAA